MQELDDAERYGTAALITLAAYKCTAVTSAAYKDALPIIDRQKDASPQDPANPAWDIVRPDGLLDAIYDHLDLPASARPALRELVHVETEVHVKGLLTLLDPNATRPAGAVQSEETSSIAIASLWHLLQACISFENTTQKKTKRSNTRKYDSRARAALHIVRSWLCVPMPTFLTLEVMVQEAPGKMIQSSHTKSPDGEVEKKNAKGFTRSLKVGLAALGGGALFAVTGGLAAPAIATGMGTLLGAGGFWSSSAAVAALTTTMATAGAATTGRKMYYRTAGVEDFGFIVLVGNASAVHQTGDAEGCTTDSTLDSKESNQHPPLLPAPKFFFDRILAAGDVAPPTTAMSTVIYVSGWISNSKPQGSVEDYELCWSTPVLQSADKRTMDVDINRFAVVWCLQELRTLNSALRKLITYGAAGQAATYGITHVVAGGAGIVATALGPTLLLGSATGMLIENAWTIAIDRAEKAGKLLAQLLVDGGGGRNPVTLVGHSMGARLIFATLVELHKARERGVGLVEDVVLMGAPIGLGAREQWSAARSVVAGRFINAYSENDWLLKVMFWQGIAKPAAGTAPVEGVLGIENVCLTDVINTHVDYIDKWPQIRSKLGDVI
jgi:hypothetical protein